MLEDSQSSFDILLPLHSYWHSCLSHALGKGNFQGELGGNLVSGLQRTDLESFGPTFLSWLPLTTYVTL